MPKPEAGHASTHGGTTATLGSDPSCCAPSLLEGSLAVEEAEALALRFKAIADPNRLRILSIISSSMGAETCVCDFAGPLQLSQPTISHHLKIMVDAGLLHREKRGVWAYYSIIPEALEALSGALTTKVAVPR